MSVRRRRSRALLSAGQVAALFGLMLPMLLALGAFVVGIGNWYVHGKHLQTKADAGALAGGGYWAFPCDGGSTRRSRTRRGYYAGPTTPRSAAFRTRASIR